MKITNWVYAFLSDALSALLGLYFILTILALTGIWKHLLGHFSDNLAVSLLLAFPPSLVKNSKLRPWVAAVCALLLLGSSVWVSAASSGTVDHPTREVIVKFAWMMIPNVLVFLAPSCGIVLLGPLLRSMTARLHSLKLSNEAVK